MHNSNSCGPAFNARQQSWRAVMQAKGNCCCALKQAQGKRRLVQGLWEGATVVLLQILNCSIFYEILSTPLLTHTHTHKIFEREREKEKREKNTCALHQREERAMREWVSGKNVQAQTPTHTRTNFHRLPAICMISMLPAQACLSERSSLLAAVVTLKRSESEQVFFLLLFSSSHSGVVVSVTAC